MKNLVSKSPLGVATLLVTSMSFGSPVFAGEPVSVNADTQLSSKHGHFGKHFKGRSFNRIATFPIYRNLDLAIDDLSDETVAEIIAASDDGDLLIYTDSEMERLGFIDISDPANPQPAGFVQLPGEPTSVSVKGPYALVGINTSSNLLTPSGQLDVIDIATRTTVASIDMGGQPDSVATSPDGRYAAVAIENERDEDIVVDGIEGGLPQLPAGFLKIVDMVGAPASWTTRQVDMTGLADYGSADPEPEYVDINRFNVATVSLQENNHLALVHLPTGKILRDFPAGEVSLNDIDTIEDDIVDPSGSLADVPREPDAVSWIGLRHFASANEGDLFGGSRGFSIFNKRGKVRYDSGNSFENLAIAHGHYPEFRAENKGAEPEGVETGLYGLTPYLFVGGERSNFVAVYDVKRPTKPVFKQLLPTGIGPEGLLSLPKRDLFVAAAEVDDAGEGFRSTVSIYQLQHRTPAYPGIKSADAPLIPWGALSGLAPDLWQANTLYAVHDSFYKQSRIYTVDTSNHPALITDTTVLSKAGETVDYDLEGIAQAQDGSFWLVSEGKPGDSLNLLVHVATDGTVLAEHALPAAVQAKVKKHGFEGVAVTESGSDTKVYVAFQREWDGDPDGHVRIGVFSPLDASWSFFYYPIENTTEGWVGLSEISLLDSGEMAVIERDNQQGPKATIKRIYTFDPASVSPRAEGETFDTVSKTLANDLLDELNASRGWTPDKVEGLAAVGDNVYVVTDNDGLDDAVGETYFFKTPLWDQ